jgi:hypothetical protein
MEGESCDEIFGMMIGKKTVERPTKYPLHCSGGRMSDRRADRSLPKLGGRASHYLRGLN